MLGEAEGTEVTVPDDGGHKPFELLVGGFGEVQGAAVQRGGHGEGNGQGGVNLGDLFDSQGVLHVAQALAAVFLGIGQTDKAHAGQFFIELHVVDAGLVTLEDTGSYFLLGEITGHLLNGKLLFGKFKIHNDCLLFILVKTNWPA